jgi:hypothetical protein
MAASLVSGLRSKFQSEYTHSGRIPKVQSPMPDSHLAASGPHPTDFPARSAESKPHRMPSVWLAPLPSEPEPTQDSWPSQVATPIAPSLSRNPVAQPSRPCQSSSSPRRESYAPSPIAIANRLSRSIIACAVTSQSKSAVIYFVRRGVRASYNPLSVHLHQRKCHAIQVGEVDRQVAASRPGRRVPRRRERQP